MEEVFWTAGFAAVGAVLIFLVRLVAGQLNNALELIATTRRSPPHNGKCTVVLRLEIAKPPPTRVRFRAARVVVVGSTRDKAATRRMTEELAERLKESLRLTPDESPEEASGRSKLGSGISWVQGDKQAHELHVEAEEHGVVSFRVRVVGTVVVAGREYGTPEWSTSAVSIPG